MSEERVVLHANHLDSLSVLAERDTDVGGGRVSGLFGAVDHDCGRAHAGRVRCDGGRGALLRVVRRVEHSEPAS